MNADTERFLGMLTAELPDGEFIELAAINGTGKIASFSADDVQGLAWFVDQRREHADLYTAMGGRTQRGRGRVETVGHLFACWVDCDEGPPEAWDETFPPTVVIATGGRTPDGQPRVQAHWFLREPWPMADELDRRRAYAINQALAQRYGGDSVQSIDHLVRLPGTLNFCKRADGTPKPLPAGVTPPLPSATLSFAPERRYDPSDLEEWLYLDGTGAGPAEGPDVAFSASAEPSDALQKMVVAGCSEETLRMVVEGEVPDGKTRSERDQTIIARAITDAGLSDDEIRALFGAYKCGDKYQQRGEGDRYLARSISRARQLLSSQRPMLVDDLAPPDVEVKETVPEPERAEPPRLPDAAWLSPFDLYLEAVRGSTEAADEHHFAAFRAVVGAFFGRRVRTHYGRMQYASDNVLLVGPTHDKKTTAQRRSIEFLKLLQPTVATISAMHSTEGLIEWLAKQDMKPFELAKFIEWMANTKGQEWVPLEPEHRRGLASVEEFASLLMKARMDGSSSLIATLTELYDQPDVLVPPLRTRRIYAERPTLTVLGASTADWLTQNLRAGDVAGGFGNRFTYWTGPSKDPMPWPPKPDADALQKVATRVVHRFESWRPGTEFHMAEGARELWDAFYTSWTNDARAGEELPTSKLESRIPEHAVKLALLYAALNDGMPIIRRAHVHAATEVAWYLRASLRYAFQNIETGGNVFAQIEEKVVDAIRRDVNQKRMLARRIRKVGGQLISSEQFNRVFDNMLKAGRIQWLDREAGTVSLTGE